MTTWGLVTTVKAPLRSILEFAAWHLELGAHRIFLYLDDPEGLEPGTLDVLRDHPKLRPMLTDDAYWRQRGRKRPARHQVRQTANASHRYNSGAGVDWLGHIDVDEFLVPEGPLTQLLGALSEDCHVARVRPMEALAQENQSDLWAFKTLTLDRDCRRRQSLEVWPTYGAYMNGGFLSHVAGKILVRAGLEAADFRIHNVFSGGEENPGSVELSGAALAHMHARNWPDWLAQYRFRHQKGSYRAELKPDRPRDKGGLTLHELFSMIETEGGEPALRQFFDEVCAANPQHLNRLAKAGLLREVHLPLDPLRLKHFPDCNLAK